MSKKKPTAMELKEAVTNIIIQQQYLTEAFKKLDFIVGKFIEFMDNEDKFKEFLEKDAKKKEEDTKDELVLPNKRS
tara:strand:+ start:397 stop:624 length:228 start_codon:yes stop_codon:yes gene_type:complete